MDGPVNDAIVLKLSSSETKAVQGTQTESYVHHLDVFIFKADSDNAKGERVHYKRYELNNSSSLTLECKRTEFAPEDRFYVYLVANASFSEEELAEQQICTAAGDHSTRHIEQNEDLRLLQGGIGAFRQFNKEDHGHPLSRTADTHTGDQLHINSTGDHDQCDKDRTEKRRQCKPVIEVRRHFHQVLIFL